MKRTQFDIQVEKDVRIRAYRWDKQTNQPVKAIIQLAHGMAEHVLRYENFAEEMVKNGYIVYGNDHRGHGNSITAPDDIGFLAEENGFDRVVSDMHLLTTMIKEEQPDIPIVLLGHSMGSFLTRRYVQLYPNAVDAIILSGTGGDQGILGKVGLMLAKLDKKRKGARTPSPLMDKLTFGNFNKNFSPKRTDFDFLSRNDQAVDAYIADEKCGFVCTTGFFIDLIQGVETVHRKEEVEKTPRHLPVLFISGDLDPVGDDGKGVRAVYEQLRAHGMHQVTLKLYPGGRHEMLHEINKEEVYADILNWMETVLQGSSTHETADHL